MESMLNHAIKVLSTNVCKVNMILHCYIDFLSEKAEQYLIIQTAKNNKKLYTVTRKSMNNFIAQNEQAIAVQRHCHPTCNIVIYLIYYAELELWQNKISLN